jgi:hypothetical protein
MPKLFAENQVGALSKDFFYKKYSLPSATDPALGKGYFYF